MNLESASSDDGLAPNRPAGAPKKPTAFPENWERPFVRWIEPGPALEALVPEWTELAARAAEPNPFYEPWMALPALRHFGRGQKLAFAFVFEPHPSSPHQTPTLIGVFPIENRPMRAGLPIRLAQLWRYPFCHLCTPIVDRDGVDAAWAAFLDALADDRRRPGLFRAALQNGDATVQRGLWPVLQAKRWAFLVTDCYARGFLRRGPSADEVLASALRGRRLHEIRRVRRALEKLGPVTCEVWSESEAASGDLDRELAQFLEMEALGWKGRESSAMRSRRGEGDYFLEVAADSVRRGRGRLLVLRQSGRAIAFKWNVYSGEGGFTMRITYDESLRRYSPGVQLEVENVRDLHRTDSAWLDSCASRDRFLVNHLWSDRRIVQTVLFATRPGAALLLSLLPLAGWFEERLASLRASRRGGLPAAAKPTREPGIGTGETNAPPSANQ